MNWELFHQTIDHNISYDNALQSQLLQCATAHKKAIQHSRAMAGSHKLLKETSNTEFCATNTDKSKVIYSGDPIFSLTNYITTVNNN